MIRIPTVASGKWLPTGMPNHAGIGPKRAVQVGPNPNRAQRRALAKAERGGGKR